MGLAGIVASMAMLEASLRLLGQAWVGDRVPQARSLPIPEGRPVLLCLGDSVTWGIGGGPGESYPDQLQGLLDRRRGSSPGWTVVNGGLAGANSRMIRQLYEAYLERARPQAVTLLLGFTNAVNWSGYRDWLVETGREPPSRWARVDGALGSIRLYRLARYVGPLAEKRVWTHERLTLDGGGAALSACLRWHRSQGEEPPQSYLQAADALLLNRYPEALSLLESCLREEPTQGACRWALGVAWKGLRREDQAMEQWRACLDVDPGDPNCLFSLGEIRIEGQIPSDPAPFQEALSWFTRGTEAAPGFSGNWWGLAMSHMKLGDDGSAFEMSLRCVRADPADHRCYSTLLLLSSTEARQARARELLQAVAGESHTAVDYLRALDRTRSMEEVAAWVAWDLRSMIQTSRALGIPVVLQTYPVYDPASQVTVRAAREWQLPLADHGVEFNRRFGTGSRPSDLLWADGLHPNGRGYEIMAWNLLHAMESANLLAPSAGQEL